MGKDCTFVLAADIGGTSSRFALFEEGMFPVPASQIILPTTGYASFRDLLEAGLDGLGTHRTLAAVLAVAGPVERGRFCLPPNIRHPFDLDALPPGLLPEHTLMINDFTAQAHGCRLFSGQCPVDVPPGCVELAARPTILGGSSPGKAGAPPALDASVGRADADSVRVVLPGRMDPSLTQAVVGPGTGLGKAALVPDGRGGYAVCGSEGGHAAFPFNGARETDFQDFARRALGEPYVRFESVVSGSGLALVHRYLMGRDASAAEVSAELTDDSPVAEWFARFLGRACRDYVLEVLARGGLYVSGGVTAKNPMLLSHPAFLSEFRSSATHADLLAKVPALLVADQLIGLRGAAALAWTLVASRRH
jgi:glucokinase